VFLEAYTVEGSLLRIYVPEASSTETVDIADAMNWNTDKIDCEMVITDLVTDISGITNATDPTFTEENNVITLDTQTPFFDFIYVRAEGYLPDVFTVHKV